MGDAVAGAHVTGAVVVVVVVVVWIVGVVAYWNIDVEVGAVRRPARRVSVLDVVGATGAGAAVVVAVVGVQATDAGSWMTGAMTATYGDGQSGAIAFQRSGESPAASSHSCACAWLRLLTGMTEHDADAVHTVWPKTGRLATVISTGPVASPP